MVIRLGMSTLVGVAMTLALFYLMQFLIAGGKSALTEEKGGQIVDIVRVKQENEVQTKNRKPKKPPPPDQPPPDVPPQNMNVNVDQTGFSMTGIDANAGIDIGGGGFGISDGEYLPIKGSARIPTTSFVSGLQGWVIVEFTVSEQGTVAGPVVVNNCAWTRPRSAGPCVDSPNGVFDSAAMRAAVKFKYKPKVIDGEPVETAGVQNRIVFELAEG